MDIEYDPTEEVVDEVDGYLDYDSATETWTISCSEHGLVERSIDGSAGSHDAMIRRWVEHLQQEHHGDGVMSAQDRNMLIGED